MCQTQCVHQDVVARVAKTLKPESTLQRLGEFYKVLGDPTRLKILTALAQDELCVCDIACLTGMSESAISHQLRLLRTTRLVTYRKQGRIVFYSLADQHVSDIITQGLNHVEE
jgi:ArsR family transcriptional regulator